MQLFKIIIHLSGFIIFGYTILWQEINRKAPISMLVHGLIHEQWKFGTQWNLVFIQISNNFVFFNFVFFKFNLKFLSIDSTCISYSI
jgi:hypothetical protein